MSQLAMVRGDTRTFSVVVTNPDTTPFNLSSSTLWFTARTAYGATPFVFQKKTGGSGITIDDAAAGLASIKLANADTSDLADAEVQLVWDLQLKAPDNSIFTLNGGQLVVTPDVTLDVS